MRQTSPSGNVTDTNAPAGGGDVTGPASSVNNNVATFNGTTGKVIQDGGKALPSGSIVGTTDTQALTNKDLSAGNTFPTLNQNTTGSAATLTTARNVDGQSFNGSADITVIAPATHAATSKGTPVDADEMPIVDSAASNVLKKLTWANLKATLKTYFDTLYQVALDAKQSVIVTGWTTGISASTTLYYAPGAFNSGSGTRTQRETRLPACTLTELRAHVGSAQSGTGALVLTVYLNGSTTALTVTIPAGTAANSDVDITGQAVAVSAGGKVSIEAAQGLGTGAANVMITLVYR